MCLQARLVRDGGFGRKASGSPGTRSRTAAAQGIPSRLIGAQPARAVVTAPRTLSAAANEAQLLKLSSTVTDFGGPRSCTGLGSCARGGDSHMADGSSLGPG